MFVGLHVVQPVHSPLMLRDTCFASPQHDPTDEQAKKSPKQFLKDLIYPFHWAHIDVQAFGVDAFEAIT